MSTTEERLTSIRKRIANIREILEDPTLLTEITVDGVAERLDRESLRRELRELESEEDRLTGASRRVYGIKLQ